MKPVYQTQYGERGNCMSAVLASLLEISLDEVPNFYEAGTTESEWNAALTKWLEDLGWALLQIDLTHPDLQGFLKLFRGYAIVSGKSPRNSDIWHATIWCGDKLVHDPCEGAPEPLASIELAEILYPLDPSRMRAA